MGFYDTLKDAIGLAKKIGNIEIQQCLIDVQQQLLDMQKEIDKLRDEKKRLVDTSGIEGRIERSPFTIITLSDDNSKVPYCSRCWDNDRKLVQLQALSDGFYQCLNTNCKNSGYFNTNKMRLLVDP